jgi:HPt (histidine-containing phosphotransfer) domain-containing protein
MSDGEILVKVDSRIAGLLPKFLAHCRQNVGEIRGAIEANNLEIARRIGHSLMGAGSSYGFDEIGSIGQEVERAARAGDVDALRGLIERLDGYLARVRPVFE